MRGEAHVRRNGYLPIESYALIGDCRSSALVGIDGSIDWCCLPRFDDASVFGRILDAERGGHWQIEPAGNYVSYARYRDRTNVLATIFHTDSGLVLLSDFMPAEENGLRVHARPHAGPRIVRMAECLSGEVEMRYEMVPRPDYGRRRGRFRSEGPCYHGDAGDFHLCIQSTRPQRGPRGTFTLKAGETAAFALRCSGSCTGAKTWSVERARSLLRSTREFWWRWIGNCAYDGPYQEHVWRSALALKLLAYAPTGAILAAPTTSLPERLGGERNWDYRYTWLRDASFTLFAFFQMDMPEEATDFFHWLRHTTISRPEGRVANLYPVHPRGSTVEQELRHLSGYRNSAPVRIGNAAADQLQLDVYGELLDSAYLYAKFGGTINRALWRELHAVVDDAIAEWQLPDTSIWEGRGGEKHHTYSKVMCWVAVDRGIRIAERFGFEFDERRWKAARREIHRRVTREGWNPRLGTFTQTLGGNDYDAAVLRISQVRFLPDRDDRVRRTIRAIDEHLGRGVLVSRYRTDADGGDGLSPGEGAFLMCSFWLADALAHLGEVEEAQRRFERLLSFASPTGLFSEEVDGTSGALLGNYPQAFTHLSLIGAAVNIERARRGHIGARGLRAPGERR